MVALELFGQLQSFNVVGYIGLEDFADRFNFLFSFIICIICVIIVTAKQYVFEALACYVSTPIQADNFDSYMNNYCWVNGTLPIKLDLNLHTSDEHWRNLEHLKMNYYQWVPLVLALQAVLCYLPRLIWQSVTFNRVGTDLNHILEATGTAAHQSGDDRVGTVNHVVRQLESLLFSRRAIRNSRLFQIRQKWWCSWLPGKRLGTALVFYYQLIKFLYLFNAIGQIYMMQRFLNVDGEYKYFGYQIVSDLITGRNWRETQVFPRIGYCRVFYQLVGSVSKTVAQCTLPINMLNEKIYAFLWFWFSLAAALEIASISAWIFRLLFRRQRLHNIIRYLKVSNFYRPELFPTVDRFERDFLKMDGNFLVHMLRTNCGEIITKEIVEAMVKRYIEEEEKILKENVQQDTVSNTPISERLYRMDVVDGDDSGSTAFRRGASSPEKEEFV